MSVDTRPDITTLSNPHRRRAWVIFQLRLRNRSLRGLARQNDISVQALSNALSLPSARMEKIIAEALDMSVTDLFPDRYGSDGARLSNTRYQEPSTARPSRNLRRGAA